ncbi:MAG: hypothetical protein U5R06_11595 [candidate division KSB1 bacterium]|nr:hypothetical protein [candidate division KSB1 bacterium]
MNKTVCLLFFPLVLFAQSVDPDFSTYADSERDLLPGSPELLYDGSDLADYSIHAGPADSITNY